MRDDGKDNPVSSSNSHLDTSFTDDQSSRHMHGDDSWKYRAPYQIQKDDEFGPVKWEAMCHCGNVQYQIKQERPLAAKYCHCRACQVLHGKSPRLRKASVSRMLIISFQLRRSNGAPSSAKPTFDSRKAPTHSCSTPRTKRVRNIKYPQKCTAQTVTRPLWMRDGRCV